MSFFLLIIVALLGLSGLNVYLTYYKVGGLKRGLNESLQAMRRDLKSTMDDKLSKAVAKMEKATQGKGEAPPLADLEPERLLEIAAIVECSDDEIRHGLVPVLNRPTRYKAAQERINYFLPRSERDGGEPQKVEGREITAESVGKVDRSYVPTYKGFGDHIDDFHYSLTKHAVDGGIKDLFGVDGKLLTEDALKIYELAYFAQGDLLELGCCRGLSGSIQSAANHASGLSKTLYTIDLDPAMVETTRGALEEQALGAQVYTLVAEGADSVSLMHSLGKKFAFAFIDHAHSYDPVLQVCKQLHTVLLPGAFVLFHDFNDTRNFNEDSGYDVVRGVEDGLDRNRFEYWGCFGCCGLYRFRS